MGLRFFLVGLLAAQFLGAMQGASAGPVSGPAGIAGPGLIAIGNQTVRLWGILMPGRETAEGAVSYRQFAALVEGRLLDCIPTEENVAAVSDGICRTPEGADIAALLVQEGWAFDDGIRSRGYYLDEMEEAAARRRGLWGLTAVSALALQAESEPPALPDEDIQDEPVAALPPAPEQPPVEAPEPEEQAVEAEPAEPVVLQTKLQVAAGRSAAQRAIDLARMRASYPWLFDSRDVELVDPTAAGGRYRALMVLTDSEIAPVCASLIKRREACLLIETP